MKLPDDALPVQSMAAAPVFALTLVCKDQPVQMQAACAHCEPRELLKHSSHQGAQESSWWSDSLSNLCPWVDVLKQLCLPIRKWEVWVAAWVLDGTSDTPVPTLQS